MKSVLLVDDDAVINFVHRRFLEKSEVFKPIEVAINVDAAIVRLKSKIEKKDPLPDLILLDIMMPLEDGFGFLQRFSSFPDEVIAKISIVVLTSSLDPKDRERSISSPHVRNFIEKPLDNAKVRQLIDML